MFCNQCGNENRNDRKFCSNCGAKLTDYTKPRENLLMPEDIVDQQNKVAKRNKVSKICNIILTALFILAVVFTISMFLNAGKVQSVLTIIAIVFDVAFIITAIVKSILLSKLNKK